MGADFRLSNEEDYKKWYKKDYKYKEIHKEAIYSIPEIIKFDKFYNKKSLKKAKIIGNPGCYPTSIALALSPALINKIIENIGFNIDKKEIKKISEHSLTVLEKLHLTLELQAIQLLKFL